MSAERLGPEAEGALGGASARGVKRYEGVQQERDVVAADIQVAPVDVGYVRQSVQILDGRTVGIMNDPTVFAVGNAENIFDRLALRVFDDGVVEFLAAGYVDDFRFHQRLLRQHADVGSDEGNLDVRIAVFDRLSDADVAREARRAGEKNEQFVILTGADGLFRGNVVRRGVEQSGALQHARRIGEPDRIPVRFNFTRSGPARACAPIEIFK